MNAIIFSSILSDDHSHSTSSPSYHSPGHTAIVLLARAGNQNTCQMTISSLNKSCDRCAVLSMNISRHVDDISSLFRACTNNNHSTHTITNVYVECGKAEGGRKSFVDKNPIYDEFRGGKNSIPTHKMAHTQIL